MTDNEEQARSTILQRREAERADREDKDRKLLLEIVKSVLRAEPRSLPEDVRNARKAFIVAKFEEVSGGT
jgi:hypothetical protein